MNKFMMGIAVLISGLLFCCPKVEASDDILPKAGFQEWEAEIECVPIYPEPEVFIGPVHGYVLTEEDEELLLRVGVLEAGEEDVEGIANVMQVVLNRFEDDAFPSTIAEVIYQKKQFTTAKRLAKANITDAAYEALYAVEEGEYTSNEALYFESCDGLVWADIHDYQFSYGGHDFYK